MATGAGDLTGRPSGFHSRSDRDLGGMTAAAHLAGAFRRAFAARVKAEPWVESTKIRPPTYGTLRVIAEREPVSQREVSELVGLHASDMVSLVDMLEGNSWVTRERSADDRRRYDLRLTKDGRTVLRRLDELAADAEAEVLAALDAAERRVLNELIAKVLDALDG